jgi:hypothetical protein
LLYLSRNWAEEYGGHLELWNRDMTKCEAKVLPLFNHVLIFSTTDYTYDGHSDLLPCPPGMMRKSLTLYYFSNGRPAEEVTGANSTLFQARKETDFNPTVGQRVRSVVGSFAAHYHAEPAAGPVIALHVAPDSGPARRRSDLC